MYSVHSIFKTIQGEGFHMGSPAVFVRFAGCNVWSGDPASRERDAVKGCCAAWCDTEFRTHHLGENGGKYTRDDLVAKVRALWGAKSTADKPMFVVFTGGEPSLQADHDLLWRGFKAGTLIGSVYLAMETNGSNVVDDFALDWVTLSPKPPMRVVDQHYDEVKCVYPAGFDPEDYARYAHVRWVQPLDPPNALLEDVGKRRELYMRRCVDYVLDHPRWKMCIQAHKHWGVA